MRTILWLLVAALLTCGTVAATPKPVKSLKPGPEGMVLLFVASACPCTDQHRVMVNRLLETAGTQGVKFYCVFSNMGETRERIEHFYRSIGWDMDYYMDYTGELAARYNATHTPQAFLLDKGQNVLYNGPIDDSAKNQGRVDHPYLKYAVEEYLGGQAVRTPQIKPAGCWIMRPDGPRPTEADQL